MDDTFLFLNGNNSQQGFAAIGVQNEVILENGNVLDQLESFISSHEGWKFGYVSYDLKNDIEELSSKNEDFLQFPKVHFFIPRTVISIQEKDCQLVLGEEKDLELFKQFLQTTGSAPGIDLKSKISKNAYLSQIEKLQKHIQKGDIYEVNFCHEFYQKGVSIHPEQTYWQLNNFTKAPFSCYGKFNDKYILSASPERFIQKIGSEVISQPIKGTARRGETIEEDEAIKYELEHNEKERSENIMIVDLVRNDFSRFAQKNSVHVEELCKIYSFDTVHQMISKVVCKAEPKTSFTDILKATFPMGSMTGAPKIRAMKLIEYFEATKRGVYSGCVGYIKPNGDFDFNVIIRTLLYNPTNKYLSCMVGGAITAKSEPEREYQETLLKVEAIKKALQHAQ